MNPLVTIAPRLSSQFIECALQAEGPALLQYLEEELAKLKEKYATEDPLTTGLIGG